MNRRLKITSYVVCLLSVFTPVTVGRLFAKLSWLRSILITIGIAGATAATWAVMFLAGVFFAIMSQS